MAADVQIPKGDYGYYLPFTVLTDAGVVYDLTDYTITLKVWPPGSPTESILAGACSIVSAVAGTCRYLITSTDFTQTGTYKLELELTKTGIVESTRSYTLEVTESA